MTSNAAMLNYIPAPDAPATHARRLNLRRFFRVIERGLAAVGLFFLIWHLGFGLSFVVSGSMAPTLRGNGKPGSDYVLTERFTYWLRPPRRWELIAFHNSEGLEIMKRITALPGESVVLKKDGAFVVDGTPAERPACIRETKYYPFGRLFNDAVAPAGSGYFVLGDDSKDSDDSRFNAPVQPADVIGRPLMILWPPSRIGFVNP